MTLSVTMPVCRQCMQLSIPTCLTCMLRSNYAHSYQWFGSKRHRRCVQLCPPCPPAATHLAVHLSLMLRLNSNLCACVMVQEEEAQAVRAAVSTVPTQHGLSHASNLYTCLAQEQEHRQCVQLCLACPFSTTCLTLHTLTLVLSHAHFNGAGGGGTGSARSCFYCTNLAPPVSAAGLPPRALWSV